MIALSPESYELLKLFDKGLTVHDSSFFSEPCINQLLENGFIESLTTDYDFDSCLPCPKSFDYVITENGKGYIADCEHDEAFRSSVKQIADSANTQAQLAKAKAQKADVKSYIALGFSAFAVFIEFAVNYDQIIAFLQRFI